MLFFGNNSIKVVRVKSNQFYVTLRLTLTDTQKRQSGLKTEWVVVVGSGLKTVGVVGPKISTDGGTQHRIGSIIPEFPFKICILLKVTTLEITLRYRIK